jgi:sialic acid synthase
MRKFEINGKIIEQDLKPFIIAEIGNNHNGSIKLCKHLIEQAKKQGADAVKLQKRCPEKLFTKELYNSPYENPNSFGSTYGTHRKALEFDKDEWSELVAYAFEIGIMLFATAFDEDSVDFLEQFNMPAYKIASGCLTDIPLIKKIADLGKPMIISTGGGNWEDVDRVYDCLHALPSDETPDFCLLHCVASYPNRAEDMNLRIIPAMMERYPNTIIGLSDHYQGYNMALAAQCLGAQIFEKHFTSDHTLPGPDHALSLEPDELGKWIHESERIMAAMGSDVKQRLPCEEKGIYKMGKAIHIARDIPEGKKIDYDDVYIRSPAKGMPPYEIDNVIGKTAKRDLSTSTILNREDFK